MDSLIGLGLDPGTTEIHKRILGTFVLVGYARAGVDEDGNRHELWLLEPGTYLCDDGSESQIKTHVVDPEATELSLESFKRWLVDVAGLAPGTALHFTHHRLEPL